MPECPELEQIFEQLLFLLPQGPAHQTSDIGLPSQSVQRRFWHALATPLYAADQAVCAAYEEFFCHSMSVDQDLWEEDYGLPSLCDPFATRLCEKVGTLGEQGSSFTFLKEVAASIGWDVNLRWLNGDHPDYPGVYSTLLVEVDIANSPNSTITDVSNWILPDSPLGDIGSDDVFSLTCTYEAVLPAHVGLVWRNLVVTLLSAIQDQPGLNEANLSLVLDSGDKNSYDPVANAQRWSDVAGSADHYNRGATSSGEASDPTFTGTVNGRSDAEYFALDGGDYFSPVGSAAFAADWHKPGANFTVIMIVRVALFGALQRLCGTTNATTGFALNIDATGHLNVVVRNAGVNSVNVTMLDALPLNQLTFVALSIDESGASTLQWADVVQSFTPVYAATSAAADGVFTIATRPDHTATMLAGGRLAAMAVWNGTTIPQSDILTLWRTLQNRWPTI